MKHEIPFILLLLLLTGLLFPCTGTANELTLSQRGEFVEVFDSGLRPRHVDGMASTTCEVKVPSVKLRLEEVVLPEVKTERIEIDVLQGGLLSDVIVFGKEALTLAEARELAARFGKSIGDIPARKLHTFSWNLVPPNSQWRAAAGFMKTYDDDRPVRFGISIVWFRPRQQMKSYRQPIPPPDGYESVAMEPYKLEEAGGDAASEAPPSPDEGRSDMVSQDTRPEHPTPDVQGGKSRAMLWWLGTGFLLAVLVAIGWRIMRRIWV